jgi:hypothetical protein
MILRRRLQHLEQQYRAGGRCPLCRDWPEQVLRFFHQDAPDEAPVPEEGPDDANAPCPACGWAPAVTEIVEVIVESQEDVVAGVAGLEAFVRAGQ